MFITFEGGEGTGKTTHVELTRKFLHKWRYRKEPVLVKRPNSYTVVGSIIRDLVLNPKYDVCKEATELLFQADLIQTEGEVLAPAITSGKDVIADRWDGSAFANPFAEGQVENIKMYDRDLPRKYGTFQRYIPDIIFYLSFDDPEDGLKRARGTTDASESKIDSKSLDYHLEVQRGFEDWKDFYKDHRNIVEIDASNSIRENQFIINTAIDKILLKE